MYKKDQCGTSKQVKKMYCVFDCVAELVRLMKKKKNGGVDPEKLVTHGNPDQEPLVKTDAPPRFTEREEQSSIPAYSA